MMAVVVLIFLSLRLINSENISTTFLYKTKYIIKIYIFSLSLSVYSFHVVEKSKHHL